MTATRCGSGHINDTFEVHARKGTGRSRFVLQRINGTVFRDPAGLMDNVRRVTEHLQSKEAGSDACLSLVAARDGGVYVVDEEDGCWRMYRFLEGMQSHDSAPSAAHAREAARAFGRFADLLRDLPGPALNETIPGFHDTPARFARLREACAADTHGRVKHCAREIDRAMEQEQLAGTLVALAERGDLPERIVHNDTKINNVMFDVQTGKAACVIDLDTAMPGLPLYDFGDMVRSVTMSSAEDEKDLSRIAMRMDYYEALADGYLEASGHFLNEAEVELLAVSGKVITIEAGIRFLVDYLTGDEYFRTHRPGQNLDRCRAHFALAASIDAQLDDMRKATAEALRRRARL